MQYDPILSLAICQLPFSYWCKLFSRTGAPVDADQSGHLLIQGLQNLAPGISDAIGTRLVRNRGNLVRGSDVVAGR